MFGGGLKRVTCFACTRRLGPRSLLRTVRTAPVFGSCAGSVVLGRRDPAPSPGGAIHREETKMEPNVAPVLISEQTCCHRAVCERDRTPGLPGAAERVPSQVMGTQGGNPHDSLTILLGLVWLLFFFLM